MKKSLLKTSELSAESIFTMEKLTSGPSSIALKASMDLCISLLSDYGFTMDEIEKFINHQTANAVRRYNSFLI